MAAEKQSLPPLASALQRWLDQEEWQDEIEILEDGASTRLSTGFKVNDVGYRLVMETDEQREQFFVYMYTPFEVPPRRMPEMARFLNMINSRFSAGRLACHDDDESNPVQFMWKIPVSDEGLSTIQISRMVGAAVQVYESWGHYIAQCNFTNRTAVELWDEFNAEREKAEAQNDDTLTEL